MAEATLAAVDWKVGRRSLTCSVTLLGLRFGFVWRRKEKAGQNEILLPRTDGSLGRKFTSSTSSNPAWKAFERSPRSVARVSSVARMD